MFAWHHLLVWQCFGAQAERRHRGRRARTVKQGLALVRSSIFTDRMLRPPVRAEAPDLSAKVSLQLQKAMAVFTT